jgi:hypothetical protein
MGTKVISREDQLSFNSKLQLVRERKAGTTYGVPYYAYNDETADKVFTTPEEKYMYGLMKQGYGGSAQDEQFRQNIRNVEEKIGPEGRMIVRQRDNFMDNAVKEMVGVQQPVAFDLDAFKTEDKERAKAVVSNILVSMNRDSKGSPMPNFDQGDAEKMTNAKNRGNTNYSLVSIGRGKSVLRMTNDDVSSKGVDVPLTKQQAEELFGQGKFLDDYYNIREAMQLTKSTGKWTTDVQSQGRDGAFNLKNGLLNKYNVKYAVEDPLKNGGLQVRMYIYDKKAAQWLPDMTANFGQLLNESQVTRFLSQAGDQYIDAELARRAKKTTE